MSRRVDSARAARHQNSMTVWVPMATKVKVNWIADGAASCCCCGTSRHTSGTDTAVPPLHPMPNDAVRLADGVGKRDCLGFDEGCHSAFSLIASNRSFRSS